MQIAWMMIKVWIFGQSAKSTYDHRRVGGLNSTLVRFWSQKEEPLLQNSVLKGSSDVSAIESDEGHFGFDRFPEEQVLCGWLVLRKKIYTRQTDGHRERERERALRKASASVLRRGFYKRRPQIKMTCIRSAEKEEYDNLDFVRFYLPLRRGSHVDSILTKNFYILCCRRTWSSSGWIHLKG